MKANISTLLILFITVMGCTQSTTDVTPGPAPGPPSPPTPVIRPIDVSRLEGVYEMTTVRYGTLPEVKGVGSLTVTALSDTSVQVYNVRSYTLVSTGEVESITKRDTCKILVGNTSGDGSQTYQSFSYSRATGGLWGSFSVETDLPKKAIINESLSMVKRIPAYKDRTITQQSLYTRKTDPGIPDPGKNVAGYVAGVYKVTSVLSTTSSNQQDTVPEIAGLVTGTGSLTLTVVNDSTVMYRNQTNLLQVASGKKDTVDEKKELLARYSKNSVVVSTPSGKINRLESKVKDKLYYDTYVAFGNDIYHIAIEYSR